MKSLTIDTTNTFEEISPPHSNFGYFNKLQPFQGDIFDFECESRKKFHDAPVINIHREINLKWVLCGIVSTVGLFIMIHHHLNLYYIAIVVCMVGFTFGAFLYGLILTKDDIKAMEKWNQQGMMEMKSSPSSDSISEDILDFIH